MIKIDNLFDLLFGSLYDKIILKVKQLRARLLLRSSSPGLEWFRQYKYNQSYVNGLLKDENLLNLFLDKDYRLSLSEDPDLRKEFIGNLEKRIDKQ